jgi:hypothetical protein
VSLGINSDTLDIKVRRIHNGIKSLSSMKINTTSKVPYNVTKFKCNMRRLCKTYHNNECSLYKTDIENISDLTARGVFQSVCFTTDQTSIKFDPCNRPIFGTYPDPCSILSKSIPVSPFPVRQGFRSDILL